MYDYSWPNVILLSGGGIATDEDSLGLPLNVIDFQSLKPQLSYLLNVYGINFVSTIWPQGYKTFFMLNSTEHEIFPAHKC